MTQRIYLDHAATTPVLPEVWDAMHAVPPGNPASAHAAGRYARRALEDARERVADLLGAEPGEVIFTSGATEANNLALFGLAGDPPGHIVAGPIEHPCVAEPLNELASRGFTVEYLPVNRNGVVDLAALPARLGPDTRLVTVQLVNHETGAVMASGGRQPPGSLLENQGADAPRSPFHSDAAQVVGKIPVHFHRLGVTALTLSGHKFGGPPGVGALLFRRGVKLRPLFFGGHQQQGRRPGTEPVALAVGLATAMEISVRDIETNAAHIRNLREQFLGSLESAAPFVVNGNGIPHILNISFLGCLAEGLLMALDLAGVSCSAGSACSSGSLLPSPVLRAMGLPDKLLRSAVRFSFGPRTSAEEILEAAERVVAVMARLRRSPAE